MKLGSEPIYELGSERQVGEESNREIKECQKILSLFCFQFYCFVWEASWLAVFLLFVYVLSTVVGGKNKVQVKVAVMSNSLQPHGLYSPWNSPVQNTGVGSLSLLQGIFPTQESNPGLPNAGGFFTN